ncbi:hypothetical protein DLJ82_1061 [Rhizobium leguminosarum]|uniref:Esterase n=1 Tax=Rhizobium leguminosarum TaxID=384 RepID=A0A2Z4YBI1_RHILE|nr:hypothetical protein DLJ82_1061 [Rhizobium leguminosarum]
MFGHAGAKVLVFPTRDGRFFEYEQLGLVASLADKLGAGHLQLYCIEGLAAETFYGFHRHPAERIRRHGALEDYILNEVLPLMAAKNSHGCTIVHGCSLGAFQAASLFFRHPHLFRKLVAFSGRYDLTMRVESFGDLFDGYYDDSVYFHMPTHFLPGLGGDWRLDRLRESDIISPLAMPTLSSTITAISAGCSRTRMSAISYMSGMDAPTAPAHGGRWRRFISDTLGTLSRPMQRCGRYRRIPERDLLVGQ